MTEPPAENPSQGTPQGTPARTGPGSKLQRLRRSLSLRTLLRSKSLESLCPRGGAGAQGPPQCPARPHGLQQHSLKKQSPCELCRQLVAGSSRQGLRCRSCKAVVHLWCSQGIAQQQCPGRTVSFRRNLSSPLLLPEQRSSEQPPQGHADAVYEALQVGTSLAHGGSPPELPPSFQAERAAAGEESEDPPGSVGTASEGAGTTAESNGAEQSSLGQQDARGASRPDAAPMFSYVALYQFVPQEQQDLALQPGDRVTLVDDSNEDWWKGKVGNRLGFFPANFVQRVRPGESVWRSCRAVPGDRRQGRMSLRENQICVGMGMPQGLLRVTSGKKRGLVPAEALTQI